MRERPIRRIAPSGLELVVDPVRQEASLWRRYRFEDDSHCRETLFNRYLKLARMVAARLFRQRRTMRLERGDFDQFACEGLLHAIDRYDPLRGVPFSAYARSRIAGNVAAGIASMSEIDAQLSHRHRVEQDRLRSFAGQGATDALATLADLAVGLAVGLMLESSGLIAGDAADTQPSAYDSLAWRETQAILAGEVEMLPDNERMVVRQHYDNGLPFAQIGQLMGVTRGRISQLHRAALDRLRKRIRMKG